jgi:uncharacterized membrane protein YjjP (DUF1212 family)
MRTAIDSSPSDLPPETREPALDTVALAAALLFAHGQSTERIVKATERLGLALGVPVRVLLQWGQVTVEIDRPPFSEIVPTVPLGVDMGKVQAVMTVVDRVCDGTSSIGAARLALKTAARLPPASTARFALSAAIGAASLGVIFGTVDAASLLIMALSAGTGALARRWLARIGGNPFSQPLCAATIAGVIAAVSGQLQLPTAQSFVALCPCMMLVPGPHILNGAIDLARTRIALGIARLAYAGLIVLMICTGLLAGLSVGSMTIPTTGASTPIPLIADVIAAGVAIACFGAFFSMPWRQLPFPIAVGMLAHAARWALISLAGANVAAGALVACVLVSSIVTPIANRLRLPFAAFGFSAVVSMMPGFFLFRAATGLFQLISIGPGVPPDLLPSIIASGTTAFLIILAMTIGLILPRMLLERSLPAPPALWMRSRISDHSATAGCFRHSGRPNGLITRSAPKGAMNQP